MFRALDEQGTALDFYEPPKYDVRHDGGIYRIPLPALEANIDAFWQALETHGFFVLTHIGAGECMYQQLREQLQAFYTPPDKATKKQCTSSHIYKSEKGVPMWYCGYEDNSFREAFRIPAGAINHINSWPSPSFQSSWLQMLHFLEKVCDRCLSMSLAKQVTPPSGEEDNKSVSYAVHYPNDEESLKHAQGDMNITAHVDPSLFVAEPCTDVDGLEVLDQATQEWVRVERLCAPGKEIIVFGGKALERATNGRIKGALHRVVQANRRRFVFIYEQKYSDYFPPPSHD